jgi:hypothetical protein
MKIETLLAGNKQFDYIVQKNCWTKKFACLLDKFAGVTKMGNRVEELSNKDALTDSFDKMLLSKTYVKQHSPVRVEPIANHFHILLLPHVLTNLSAAMLIETFVEACNLSVNVCHSDLTQHAASQYTRLKLHPCMHRRFVLRVRLIQETHDASPKLGWRRPMDPTVGDICRGADLHAH